MKSFILCLIILLSGCASLNTESSNVQMNTTVVVDFSQPSTAKRLTLYVNNEIVLQTYVTHGIGSGEGIYATKFSNNSGSHMSSLGRFKISGRYVGHNGLSIRLIGLDSSNNKAEEREVVIHAARYIGNGRTGHSWGCFGVMPSAMQILLKYLNDNSTLIAED